MTAARQKIPPITTVEEFFAWPGDGMGGRYQLIDGELRAMPPASAIHVRIQGNIIRLIGNHLDTPGSRCQAVPEPAIEVRIRAKHNLRVPDVGVTCALDRPGEVLLPDPILLVEVLSHGNASDTWENVWAYTTIRTVSEILVVHSERIFAELLRRDGDGSWPKTPEEIEDGGRLLVKSIDYETPLKALYRKTYLETA